MSNQFLTNYTTTTFLEKIKDNLRHCTSFSFSVSFIKKAGLVLLFKDIEAAVERGAHGRLITSTYQNFTDIESLKSFLNLQSRYPNFACHLDHECFHDNGYSVIGFHSKGYLFEFDDSCEVIVGSSNITRYALQKNIEWDLVVHEKKGASVYKDALNEFEEKWQSTCPLDSEIISRYSTKLNFAIERWDMDYELSTTKTNPNFMQRRALKELNRYRAMGTDRALVVAAAGSGKTYLAAFDALNFNPRKLLYIVHEGSILRKSLETFQEVFGNTVTYGIYDGQSKDLDADFLFSTNVTMCKAKDMFSKDEFDYIVIDECHHAAAKTYQEIIDYFKPEFMVGLTATPERMDNEDVFELFGNNIPYELRLRDAIINDLIVPFKYYGIRDTLVEYGLTNAQTNKLVAQLSTSEHCSFVKSKIEEHRPEGKLKALAFCRNVSHARMMSEEMAEQGYKTAYLTGKNKVGERIKAYNDLQSDDTDLEILFTVDILNEGVDIPGVNMVLFLRPTDSSTIFIQQLGRGLRKYPNKDYVTVLDFIGNDYKRSVQIAFALGSLAKNFILEKRLLKSLVADDFKAVGLGDYGVEINIDDLSKEEIIEYIDSENFNKLDYIKQDYFNFKKYLNCETYPKHIDYLNTDVAPDLIRFMNKTINGKKANSYYNFLKGIEEDVPIFSEAQENVVNALSTYLPLVRAHEYIVIDCLLKNGGFASLNIVSEAMSKRVRNYDSKQLDHAVEFLEEKGCIEKDGNTISIAAELDSSFEEYLTDLIEYGLTQYAVNYAESDDFQLWHSYRINQVQLKLLKNPGSNQKGTYVYDDITEYYEYEEDKDDIHEGTVLIFASLKKDASVEEHLNYKDKFLEPGVFQWECEAGLNKKNQQELIDSKQALVFVRKVKAENGMGLPFTYVGKGKLTNPRDSGNAKGALLFDVIMENELPDYLQYDFGLTKKM